MQRPNHDPEHLHCHPDLRGRRSGPRRRSGRVPAHTRSRRPPGDAVLGGNAPTSDGILTPAFRTLAGIQSIFLLLLGWVLLARATVMTIPLLDGTTLSWITWVIVVFLALNTVANLAAPHPVERWVMGSIALLLTGMSLAIALRAPDLA